MAEFADLELGLHRHQSGAYALDFRFSLPDSDAEIRLSQGEAALAEIDIDRLRLLESDINGYGVNSC